MIHWFKSKQNIETKKKNNPKTIASIQTNAPRGLNTLQRPNEFFLFFKPNKNPQNA